MSFFTHLTKTRPVCHNCGHKCGRRYRSWPREQSQPTPWDGETWVFQYNPFCTLRCALEYARKCTLRCALGYARKCALEEWRPGVCLDDEQDYEDESRKRDAREGFDD